MPYCSQCRVEVEKYVDLCPLCGTPIREEAKAAGKKRAKFPDKPVIDHNNGKTGVVRFLVWEIVSVSLATALAIVFLTNLIVDLRVTWSAYPMAAIVLAWLLASFPLLLSKKPLLVPILSAASILLFLAFLDLADNLTFDWFYLIALPIAILVIIVTALVVLVGTKVKKKGFNIAAFILFGIGLIAAGLDVIINFAQNKTIAVSWSVFVIIPILFTGIFLLYIHYRLVKAVDIKKWFQI